MADDEFRCKLCWQTFPTWRMLVAHVEAEEAEEYPLDSDDEQVPAWN